MEKLICSCVGQSGRFVCAVRKRPTQKQRNCIFKFSLCTISCVGIDMPLFSHAHFQYNGTNAKAKEAHSDYIENRNNNGK